MKGWTHSDAFSVRVIYLIIIHLVYIRRIDKERTSIRKVSILEERGLAKKRKISKARTVKRPGRSKEETKVPKKVKKRRRHTKEDHRRYVANLLSGLIIFLGFLNIISITLPYITKAFNVPTIEFLPPEFTAAGGFIHVIIGIFLVYIGHRLYLRRRGAWTVILFFLSFSLIASILSASILMAGFTTFLIAMLWEYRDMFRTPSVFKLSPKRMATVLFACIMVIVGVVGSISLGSEFDKPIDSWSDAAYFTISTITTVGYGDHVPTSPAAQWFTIFLMIMGFSSFLLLIGTLLGPYIEERLLRVIGMVGGIRTERLANHLIVCGTSVEGRIIIETLKDKKEIFVVVCGSGEKHEELIAEGIPILFGDPSEGDVLIKAGAMKARALLATSDDDALNAFITITAKKLNPNLRIVAMVSTRENISKLRTAGADRVISPSVIGAERILSAAVE
jgi:voltage-gated potassium channel